MYGAILGDMVGAPYEFDRGHKTKDFPLFTEESQFTDDSVMTLAVAEALLDTLGGTEAQVKAALVRSMQKWGHRYPNAGYGGMFYRWLRMKNPKPYGSFGNGSAMRVAAAGWLYDSLEETRQAARWTAEVTHNHPEGVLICFVCLEYAATCNNLNKGGHCMEITRNEESRIISVWLTNADQQNEEIQNWLKGKYPVWKKEGYLTVVYKSGHEDLYENTLALLKHNRRLSAQKEVEAEKRARKQAEAERLAGKQPAAEMSASALPAAEMRTGMQAAADQAAKPSILEKLGKKPPQVQSRAKQRTRKRSEMER